MPSVPVLTWASAAEQLTRAQELLGQDYAVLVVATVDEEDEKKEEEEEETEASLAGSYWANGYRWFMETGEEEFLEPFEGKTVGGYPLMTDPDLIEEFYNEHGDIDFREYYQP
jgi:hypothetical protein